VLSQDSFAFDSYRVLDTVIMGNKRLWGRMEEREVIYAKAELTDDDGMRLGELEGTVAKRTDTPPTPMPHCCFRDRPARRTS